MDIDNELAQEELDEEIDEMDAYSLGINKIKCTTCVYKFECLAKHHIPKNYGKDCKKFKEVV